MSAVVRVGRVHLTLSAEIRVVTHRALVASSCDEARAWPVPAQRAVTVDAIVHLIALQGLGDCVIKRRKPMTRMVLGCFLVTLGAVIPVWAGQTLVPDANNTLR